MSQNLNVNAVTKCIGAANAIGQSLAAAEKIESELAAAIEQVELSLELIAESQEKIAPVVERYFSLVQANAEREELLRKKEKIAAKYDEWKKRTQENATPEVLYVGGNGEIPDAGEEPENPDNIEIPDLPVFTDDDRAAIEKWARKVEPLLAELAETATKIQALREAKAENKKTFAGQSQEVAATAKALGAHLSFIDDSRAKEKTAAAQELEKLKEEVASNNARMQELAKLIG